MNLHTVALFTAILLLFCLVLPADAQSEPPLAEPTLAYGERANGAINDQSARQAFTFAGLRGDLVQIVVRVAGGDLDPTVLLADADGTTVIFRDDSLIVPLPSAASTPEAEAGGDAGDVESSTGDSDLLPISDADILLSAVPLPASGTYTLTVGRFGDQFGTTAGEFTLLIARVGASAESGSTLRYGDSIIHQISDSQPQAYYSVRAGRGDILSVQMQRMSGDLDSTLTVTDANGFVLAENDDGSAGNLNAEIRGLIIPEEGQYIIIASRFGGMAGRSAGAFVLSVNAAPEGGQGSSTQAALPIAPGESVQGEITAARARLFYEFDGRAGQVVTITMSRASGNLDPLLILLDGSGQEIASNDDSEGSQNAAIVQFALSADGRYQIAATRYAGPLPDGTPSATTGDFTLTLSNA